MFEDDDDDEDEEELATLSLEGALAWVATRNTAFVQIVSASRHSDNFGETNLDRLAIKANVEMAFAKSTLGAWGMLRSSIATGQVRASGICIELTPDYEPGTGTPNRAPRLQLTPGIANDLELVESFEISLRPRELGSAPRWWFKVEVNLKQIKTAFPVQTPPVAEKLEKRKKGSPLQDYAETVLQELYPDGPPPVGISVGTLAARVEAAGGPKGKDNPKAVANFTISSKTVGRAAEKLWPGWLNSRRS